MEYQHKGLTIYQCGPHLTCEQCASLFLETKKLVKREEGVYQIDPQIITGTKVHRMMIFEKHYEEYGTNPQCLGAVFLW